MAVLYYTYWIIFSTIILFLFKKQKSKKSYMMLQIMWRSIIPIITYHTIYRDSNQLLIGYAK